MMPIRSLAFLSRLRLSAAIALAVTCFASTSVAGSREECVEAHSRAQDQRERGQLARARQTFLSCAQATCPTLVQQDCARFGEELAQLVPSVTFSARDANAADLPATSVYVDEVLVTTRLDDGRSYEVDPGRHLIRYVHDGRETTMKVVLNQGERGRLLVATFVDRSSAASARRDVVDVGEPPAVEAKRSVFPLVIAGIGAAAAITGGVLFGVGSASVPSSCSVSARECAAPPNDPSLAKAESGVRMQNAGIGIGIGGVVTLLGGVVWYFVQPTSSGSARRARLGGPVLTF